MKEHKDKVSFEEQMQVIRAIFRCEYLSFTGIISKDGLFLQGCEAAFTEEPKEVHEEEGDGFKPLSKSVLEKVSKAAAKPEVKPNYYG